MTKSNALVAWCVIVLLAIGVNTYIGLHTAHRQHGDEHASCVIQSRGLQAQRHLTNIMGAIDTLLSPPTSAKPAPVPPQYRKPLETLHQQLPLYLHLEREQPSHRNC